MTSDFDSFIGDAFAAAAGVFGTQTLTSPTGTGDCVPGPVELTNALRDSGFFEKVNITATLARATFVLLAIGDRTPLELNGRRMKVILIEDDGVCPIVTLHLQKQN